MKNINSILVFFALTVFFSCSNYFKNDYDDNSPTSGKLKVYYDEGLRLHVVNQTNTFEAHYPNASVSLHETSENDAVAALLNDSCQSIVIARNLNYIEQKMFAVKHYTPSFSIVALTGVAVIVNAAVPLKIMAYDDLVNFLKTGSGLKDSLGNDLRLQVLFDKNNSGVLHYMMDSVLKENKLSSVCNTLGSSIQSINYVASTPNSMALIDFAWISDQDDSIVVANKGKIRTLALSKVGSAIYEYPSQSSFKLGTYPFIRFIHVFKKTGEFSLAKGFQSFIMGPNGQMTFLKQGLMPARQSERSIKIKLDPSLQPNN